MMNTSSFQGVRVASKARQATKQVNTNIVARRTKAAVSESSSVWYGACAPCCCCCCSLGEDVRGPFWAAPPRVGYLGTRALRPR